MTSLERITFIRGLKMKSKICTWLGVLTLSAASVSLILNLEHYFVFALYSVGLGLLTYVFGIEDGLKVLTGDSQ